MSNPPGNVIGPPFISPLSPGSSHGKIRKIYLEDVDSFFNSPDYSIITAEDIIAADPQYTMPVVPPGVTRLIIGAIVQDVSVYPDPSIATILMLMGNNTTVPLDTDGTTPVAIGETAIAAARVKRLVMPSGSRLRMTVSTEINTGGIRYIDVNLG